MGKQSITQNPYFIGISTGLFVWIISIFITYLITSFNMTFIKFITDNLLQIESFGISCTLLTIFLIRSKNYIKTKNLEKYVKKEEFDKLEKEDRTIRSFVYDFLLPLIEKEGGKDEIAKKLVEKHYDIEELKNHITDRITNKMEEIMANYKVEEIKAKRENEEKN